MTIMVPTRLETAEKARAYILGGRSLFTVCSNTTNRHLTYRVTVCKRNAQVHFVWAKTNSGNRYVGCISKGYRFFYTKKSMPRDYVVCKSFVWAWRHIINKSMPKTMAIYHHNTCCRCGRNLTHPKSIKSGIGPECVKMVGG